MRFNLPDELTAEAAGRAMALRVREAVEVGVAPCLAGAAALVAARLLMLRGIPVTIALTDPVGASDSLFQRHLHLLRKMKARINVENATGEEFPCVISGTDNSATMGSSSFLVAKAFLDPAHSLRWDGWMSLKNPYLYASESYQAITTADARDLDRIADEQYHLPQIALMEQAGIGAAVATAEFCANNTRNGEIVVLAGPGNNGGDAFVVARGLLEKGMAVRVIPLADHYTGAAEDNLRILEQQRHFIDSCRDEKDLNWERLGGILNGARVVVDGLFGIGLDREVSGEYAELIARINACGAPVISLDVPSGLHADTGEIMGCAVKATRTVTFAAPKKGLYLGAGPDLTGDILTAAIGNPE